MTRTLVLVYGKRKTKSLYCNGCNQVGYTIEDKIKDHEKNKQRNLTFSEMVEFLKREVGMKEYDATLNILEPGFAVYDYILLLNCSKNKDDFWKKEGFEKYSFMNYRLYGHCGLYREKKRR